MYGTISFSNSDKRASAEFHAFSSVHGRQQRQPACDECRTARVKCREKSNRDKCARCHGTSRACTYNSTTSRSRHSGKPTEPTKPTPTANGAGEHNEDEDGHGAGSPSASSPQSSTPPLQHTHAKWRDGILDCRFEPFDAFVDPGTDTVMDGSPNAAARQQVDADMGSVNDKNRTLHLPGLGSVSTALEQDVPHSYDFPALSNEFLPHIVLSTPSPSSMPSLIWSAMNGHVELQKSPGLSLDTRLDHPASPQRKSDTQDDVTPQAPALTGFSDLIDVMRFAGGPALSRSATPASNTCTCLQDLTANLFSLRNREEKVQVDHFLLLFKQAMCKWRAVETCSSACCISQSLALLMLMSVQELVTLLLEATSSVNAANNAPGRRDSILAIRMGSFTVEDEADRRFMAQMLLATRMKELHSFITRISSKMKLAGLDDMSTEYQHQIELLRKAFTS